MRGKGWVYTADGRVIEKGTPEHDEYLARRNSAIYFVPDEASFVSPIDRKEYSGRVGMREHNAKHGVVSNRDLTGLPTRMMNQPIQETRQTREARREAVIHAARQAGVLNK